MRILNANDMGFVNETMAVHDPINEFDPMYRETMAEDLRNNWCARAVETILIVSITAMALIAIHGWLRS